MKIDNQKLEVAAKKIRILCHPQRIKLLELLTKNDEQTVTKIYKKLKIEQATASHHLALLKEAGVVTFRRDGKQMQYSVVAGELVKIMDFVNSY